jgi:hypothetical protein
VLWRWSSYRAWMFGESGTVKVIEWRVLKMKGDRLLTKAPAPR